MIQVKEEGKVEWNGTSPIIKLDNDSDDSSATFYSFINDKKKTGKRCPVKDCLCFTWVGRDFCLSHRNW